MLPDGKATAWPLGGAYGARLREMERRWRVEPEATPLILNPGASLDARALAERKRNAVRVPLVADMAAASADMLFGQSMAYGSDDDAVADRLAVLADGCDLGSTLLEASEQSAALGGTWLRVGWDTSIADGPLVSAVSPTLAVGEWRWGYLVGATIARVLSDEKKLRLVHVEHHEPGVIEHGLYAAASGATELGVAVPLNRHPLTAGLSPRVELPAPVMLVSYVANIRPSRYADYGRADADRADSLLDAVDMAATSWIRDVRLGRARAVVPNDWLRREGRGKGAQFDTDQEIFVGLDLDPKDTGKAMEVIQPDIRAAAHEQTLTALIERVLVSCGYAPESFGQRTTGLVETASAMRLREQRSLRTVDRKRRYWRRALVDTAWAMLTVDAFAFGRGAVPVADERPAVRVTFGEYIAAGRLELANTATALRAGQAASTQERVRLVHPEWTDDEVVAEVALINTENVAPDSPMPPVT